MLPCSSFVEQYLGGRFDIEMQCIEAKEEPATKTTENFLQLTCFISPEVKYMHSGLRSVIEIQRFLYSIQVCLE